MSQPVWKEVGTIGDVNYPEYDGGPASGETAVEAVARKLNMPEDGVAEVARTLDWWQEEIPRGTSGHTYVWAKKAGAEIAERRQPRRRR